MTSTVSLAASQLSITKVAQSGVTQASNPTQTGPIFPIAPSGLLTSPGAATSGSAVIPGTQLTYRLMVVNNGPSDIANIQVRDTLPAGVTYVGANQVSGNATFTCFFSGGTVTCNAPLLPAPLAEIPNTIRRTSIS
ncbi:MAG: DUF11 domain-containing protein [Acidobacteria bacterium]|nr:DUF11 domain-containing protein [Acidobacteriota bacterium]